MGDGAYDADNAAECKEGREEWLELIRQGAIADARAQRKRQLDSDAVKMRERYAVAKATKVGESFACSCCGKSTVKTTYQKAFCNNQKTTGKGINSCKDRYWNLTDEVRRERSIDILTEDNADEDEDDY